MNIQVQTKHYLGLSVAPKRIADVLAIAVSSHAYLPKTEDLASDWVASVAAPAFKLIRQQAGKAVPSFCSIGTGSGLDVLAAIELLGSTRVGFTDLQEDVVDTAVHNVRDNLRASETVAFEYGAGDLLSPLAGQPHYDVIYENLPNVPLAADTDITDSRNSGHYLEKRAEPIPELVHRQMLDLHYLALRQAKDYLTETGSVYSTLGGRVALDVFRQLGELAGFSAEIFTYTWKVQAEAAEVLAGYAKQEAEGLGPFHFYRVADLKAVFADVVLETSGRQAFALEKALAPKALSAKAALSAWQKGEAIGHTVVVLKSTPKAP